MRTMILTFALVFAAISGSAEAEPAAVRGQPAKLHLESSAPGESLDDFVARIAPRALEASKSTRATVCGEVDGTGPYTVALKTDGYVSTCNLPASTQPYVLINGTATDARENHFSQANWKRPGYLVTPWAVKFQDGKQKRPRTVR